MKKHILLTFALFTYCIAIIAQNSSSYFPKVIELKKDIQVREEPDINYPIKDIIRNGNYIELLDEVDSFYKIKHVGKISYTLKNQIDGGIINPSNNGGNDKSMQPVKYNDIYSTTNKDTQSTYPTTTQAYNTTSTTRTSGSSSYKSSYSSLCGARTKKGGSCQRRVAGGGRCWQH